MKISIGLFLIQMPVHAQISKSAFSFKLSGGYSFSRFTLHQDFNIKNRNLLVLSPQFSYNILTKKRNIIETGIGLFTVGNKIAYYDNTTTMINSVLNTNQVYGLPLSYYKNIDRANNRVYLGIGTLLSYNFSKSSFTNYYTDFTETTTHNKGLKVNLTAGIRYFVTVKKKPVSMELIYSRGMVNFYNVNIVANYAQTSNIITNNGSSLQIAVTYFFGKNKKVVEN